MTRLILRIIINAVALWIAASVLGPEHMSIPTDWQGLLIVALVFGVVNALIRPIVSIFTCLLNILTLGLFTFVINALMLMLTGWLTGSQLEFSNFGWALLGGIVVSIISTVLSWFLPDNDNDR
ncbi:MAG: phage holin family protein [Caldilineaceae bacterium]